MFIEAGLWHSFSRKAKLPFKQKRKNRWSGFSASSLNSFSIINTKNRSTKPEVQWSGVLKRLQENPWFFQPKRYIHNPGGYFHILGGLGAWPQICLWNSCWSPKFCLQKYRWQIPEILPSEFQIWPQNWDLSPTFASCGNRTSQVFPLVWWTWLDLDLAPNFASKLDEISNPPPPPPPNTEVSPGIHKGLIYQIVSHICQNLFLLQHIEWPLLEIDSCNVLNIQWPINLWSILTVIVFRGCILWQD